MYSELPPLADSFTVDITEPADEASSEQLATLCALYREHGATIYARALMFCTPADAARITAEVFTSAWAEPDRFDPLHHDVRHQLLIASNERILSTLDGEYDRQTRRSLQTGNPLPPDEHVGALTPTIGLRQLAPLEREAIVYTLHTGMTYRRVAAVTGRSPAAIAANLRRGLQELHRAQAGPATGSSSPANDDASDSRRVKPGSSGRSGTTPLVGSAMPADPFRPT